MEELKHKNEEEHHHHHQDEEEDDKSQIIRIILAIVLFVISILVKNELVEKILQMAAYIVVGFEVLIGAVYNIGHGQLFDESFLMSLATIGSIALGETSEAVSVMLLYQIGEFLQDLAVDRSRKSVTAMLDLRPDTANLKVNDRVKVVHPSEVKVGDTIEIRPGEKVPLDGVVVEGYGSIDTKALTGESMLRDVEEGQEVLSGSISSGSVFSVKVIREFFESTASKILELIENATEHKSDSEKFITKFSRIYTPVVVFSALFIGLVYPLIVEHHLDYDYIYRALVFLMVSCPCALVISIPLSYFGGIGGASANGIVIKGGNYLEDLAKIDTMVFDKTGTLTKGEFEVTGVFAKDNNEEQLLEIMAYAEYYSPHPIGQSIVLKYEKEIDTKRIQNFNEVLNRGTICEIDGNKVVVGNEKFLDEQKTEFERIDSYESIIYCAINGNYVGYITISDVVKDTTIEALDALKKVGISNLLMVTGDQKRIAKEIAKKLGVTDYYAECLPQQKVEYIEKLKNEGKKVAYVGDGMNDAPVLLAANIGIAMGALGSDAAIEASDIVLADDDLRKITKAVKIAKKTRRIVYENIILAIGTKLIVLILGALGKSNMWFATFADVGVAIICVLNSIRLIKK